MEAHAVGYKSLLLRDVRDATGSLAAFDFLGRNQKRISA